MTKQILFCLLFIFSFADGVFSQTVRKYQYFQVELDNNGNVIGIRDNDIPGAACGNPEYKKGVITRVHYGESYKNDGKSVMGVTIRYSNGRIESFDYESASPGFSFPIWELPPNERQPINGFFARNRKVIIGTEVCGSAGFKSLISIRDNSPQSEGIAPRRASISQDWDTFWTAFSAAVRNRDRTALKRMMSSPFEGGGAMLSPDEWIKIIDQVRDGETGWPQLRKSVASGTKPIGNYGRRPQRITNDGYLIFELATDGKWR
jgi:hypothetical protein